MPRWLGNQVGLVTLKALHRQVTERAAYGGNAEEERLSYLVEKISPASLKAIGDQR